MLGFLIFVIWVGYGAFAAYQTKDNNSDEEIACYFFYMAFSPIVFIIKAFYGAFKIYK